MMTRRGCALISKCSCHRLPARQNDGHAEPPEARALTPIRRSGIYKKDDKAVPLCRLSEARGRGG